MKVKPDEVIELIEFASLFQDVACRITNECVRNGERFVVVRRVVNPDDLRPVLEVQVGQLTRAGRTEQLVPSVTRFVLASSVLRVHSARFAAKQCGGDPFTMWDLDGLHNEKRRRSDDEDQRMAAENAILFVAIGYALAWEWMLRHRGPACRSTFQINEALRAILGPTRTRDILAKVRP